MAKRLTHDQEIVLDLEIARNASLINALAKRLEMLIEFKSTHELSMAVTKLQEAIVWIKKDNERIKKELRGD
jgi:hypothetical protein